MCLRRAAGLLGAALVLSLVVVAPAPEASADAGTAPRVWCAVRVSNTTPGASHDAWVSCTAATGFSWQTSPFRIMLDGTGSTGAAHSFDYDILKNVSPSKTVDGQHLRVSGTAVWDDPGGAASIALDGAKSGSGAPVAGALLFELTNTTADGCWQLSSQCTAVNQGLFESITVGTGFPDDPPEGGTPDPEPPEVDCWVDVSNDSSIWRASFGSRVNNPQEAHPDSFMWDFGDASDPSTESDPVHVYASGDDDGSPWVATLTTTRASEPDHVCTVTFDFFGPAHVDGDQGGEGDVDETGCGATPSAWPPHSYIVGWVKKLLIPCGTVFQDKFTEASDLAEDQWPLGPVAWFVSTVSEGKEAMESGVVPAGFPGLTQTTCGAHLRVPVPLGLSEDVGIEVLRRRDGACTDPGGLESVRKVTHWGTTIAGWWLVALAIYTAAYGLFREKTVVHSGGD